MNLKRSLASVAVLALMLGVLVVPAFAAYDDVAGHWAEEDINEWVEAGWINGYPDGTFRPNNTVIKSEFVAFLNRSFGFEEKAEISFADVAEEAWYYEVAARAVAAGYIENDEAFNPNAEVTREVAALLIGDALGLTATDEAAAITFTDADQIEYVEQVNAVVAEGIFIGDPEGTFRPNDTITRAEAVTALERARVLVDAPVATGTATVNVKLGALGFKEITVTETTVAGAAQYEVKDSVKAINETVVTLLDADTAELTILAANGTVLATGTVDVSADATDLVVDLDVVEVVAPEDATATVTVVNGALGFKQITVNSNDVNVVNVKVKSNVKAVGEEVVVLAEDSATVELLGADDAVLYTFELDFNEEYTETTIELE